LRNRLLPCVALLCGLAALATTTAASAAPPARILVLHLQAYDAPRGLLDEGTSYLQELLGAHPETDAANPWPALIDRNEALWLESDKLLFDGKTAYQALSYDEAEPKLLRAAEIMESSHRALADPLGPRRLRETYLHLGMAFLERDQTDKAVEWLKKAVTVDPGFEPDPRLYAPAVRTAYGDVRRTLTGAPARPSGTTLAELAATTSVDVIVATALSTGPKKSLAAVTWDNRAGTMFAETVQVGGASLGQLKPALRVLSSSILGRVVGKRTRTLTGSYAMAMWPRATIPLKAARQPYEYEGGLTLNGVAVSMSPWRNSQWVARATLALYLPRDIPGDGGLPSGNPRADIGTAAALFFDGARWWRYGAWRAEVGGGLSIREVFARFRSSLAQKSQLFVWASPHAFGSVRRSLPANTFVELELGAEYDVFSQGFEGAALNTRLGAGVEF
jgi:tetratricopeptide (TPR) repeat protein